MNNKGLRFGNVRANSVVCTTTEARERAKSDATGKGIEARHFDARGGVDAEAMQIAASASPFVNGIFLRLVPGTSDSLFVSFETGKEKDPETGRDIPTYSSAVGLPVEVSRTDSFKSAQAYVLFAAQLLWDDDRRTDTSGNVHPYESGCLSDGLLPTTTDKELISLMANRVFEVKAEKFRRINYNGKLVTSSVISLCPVEVAEAKPTTRASRAKK